MSGQALSNQSRGPCCSGGSFISYYDAVEAGLQGSHPPAASCGPVRTAAAPWRGLLSPRRFIAFPAVSPGAATNLWQAPHAPNRAHTGHTRLRGPSCGAPPASPFCWAARPPCTSVPCS